MANSEEYHDGDEVQLAPSNSSEGETLLALERFLDNISGWYQIVSLIGLCLADISASSLLFVIAFIKDELGVSDTLQGVISASVFVGMFFGGFYAGIIADNIGRKPCLMATMFINLFSGTLVALFPGSWIWILLCRFIAGVGIGGVLSSCFAMAAEIVGPKYRGPYIALLCTSSTIAGIYTAGSCWIILGQLNLHWIIACFATQLPNVPAILLAYFWICETPKYHFVNGEIDKSRLCLQHMSSKSRKEYIDIFSDIDMTQLQSPELTENEVVRKSTRQLVGMLFQDGLSPLTLALGATWFSMSFGWYGIILWIPSLFKEYGSTADIYEQAFMVPVAGLVGNIIITLSVSRFGGSLLLSTFMCFSFIVVGCMAFVDSLTAVVILACVYNAGSTAAWDALSCVSAEIYPTHIRGTAVGFMNAVEQVASGISQLAFGVAFSYSLSPFYILFPSACTMAAGAIAALFVHHKLKHKPTDTTEEALTQSNSEDQNIDPPIELRNSM